jgi:hypothetical protein
MTNIENTEDKIYVRSHVARDLLQNAALFKNEKLVVWEYVSNGLDYIDPGTSPIVKVTLDGKQKKIVVKDNGRGMDWSGLQNFFIMHGENIDRKQGRPGRGRFGTGKSAAFGIADILRVTTVRNGKRSRVELRREDITEMNSEDPIPVNVIERETNTDHPNGTMVEIERIHLKSLDQAGVIQFIERHLARWRNAVVYVNNHECEFIEPQVFETRIFNPEGALKNILGNVELEIKVACSPLDEDFRGVSVFANGVWHETTLAGSEGREMSQFIFGEIDIPKLDEDESPISPFDLSRSMRLNPSNELVQAIYAFIGQKIDQVRRDLVKSERDRKASEEAKKLLKQAQMIAEIINEDFNDFKQRIAKAQARTGGRGFDYGTDLGGGTGLEDISFGGDIPAKTISQTGEAGSIGGERKDGIEPRRLKPQVSSGSPEDEKIGRQSGKDEGHPSSRGGFQVEFKQMGEESKRALYVSDERKIYINLDHPQLLAAKGNRSIEDPLFQRLSYEVAFSEYAIALASELNENNNYIDTSDPIYDIRETINRVARKSADMFAT